MRDTVETNRDWRVYWTHDWGVYWASVSQYAGRDDLMRQVGRTVGGKPDPQHQVDLVIAAITQRLNLGSDDILLDLCCGNGLVTARLASLCRAVVGVDYSPELLRAAQEHFAAPNTIYLHRAAEDLHPADFPMGLPTKVCMNSALQYFTEAMMTRLLQSLRSLAQPDLVLFFTDVPDAAKIDAFADTPERRAEFDRRRADGTEALGTWWDRDHLGALFRAAGYTVSFIAQDPARSRAHYLFDVLARLAPRPTT